MLGEFLIFLGYTTAIFCLSNTWWVILTIEGINLIYGLARRTNWRKTLLGLGKILPFILLTFGFNVWLDTLENAIYITVKLVLVCQITLIYSQTTSVAKFAKMIATLLSPFKTWGLKPKEVELMICIAMSVIPAQRRNAKTTRSAMKAKNLKPGLKSMRSVAVRMMDGSLRQVKELDEAMRAKGVAE